MKKLLFIFLLLLPLTVKAVANVEVTNVEKVEQSNTTIINAEPTFEGIKVRFDFKFTQVGDYVKYKVTIKNNADKDYEVDIGSVFSEGDYIEYAFALTEGDSEVLKSTESKDIILTIKYNKKVPVEKYTNGAYVEQSIMSINLSNDDAIHASVDPASANNPKTGAQNILIFLAILLISGVILTIAIKKNNKMILPMLLLLIPLTVHALEKITIDVEAKIEIENIYYQGTISACLHGITGEDVAPRDFYFEKGMTWAEFMESEYFNALSTPMKENIYYYDDSIGENIFNLSFQLPAYNECMASDQDNCYEYTQTVSNIDEPIKSKEEGQYKINTCK